MNIKELEKTKKLAHITRILCRISIWAAAIGIALLAITVIVAYVVPPEHIKPLQESGKLSVMITGSMSIPAETFTDVESLRAYLFGLLNQVTAGAVIYVLAVVYLMGLLKSVEQGEPFAIENVKRLRRISIVLIVGSLIVPSVSTIAAALSAHTSFLDVRGTSMVDTTLLLCGFLVLVLSGIFAYGARLQREHDQTV